MVGSEKTYLKTYPCGYLSDPAGKCTCTHPQIQRYRAKISGPLLDRMDIQVEVPKVAYKDLSVKEDGEHSIDVKKRVDNAIDRQTRRFSQTNLSYNSQMTASDIKQSCPLDHAGDKIMEKAVDVLGLSVRACHSVIKVARTIADLDSQADIQRHHLAEAVQYRSFDR